MRLDKNASSFIVMKGFIVGIGKQSKINSPRSGIFPVKWKNGRLPDNVKIGEYVTIYGQLITLDLGRGFQIIKAQGLNPTTMQRFKKFIEGEINEEEKRSV